MPTPEVCVAVLNWNGGDQPLACLEALAGQTWSAHRTVVVDNGSSDGSPARIRDWSRRHPRYPVRVLRARRNLGAGGGYALALRRSTGDGFEWTWLLDQDTVPEPRALEELLRAYEVLKDRDRIGIMASLPVDQETGFVHRGLLWTGRRWKGAPRGKCRPGGAPFSIDSTLTTGTLVHRRAVEAAGLPREDFFIDYVDHEYHLRVRQQGHLIYQVPSSRVLHTVGKSRSSSRGWMNRFGSEHPAWRRYYAVRNDLYTHAHGFRSPAALFFRLLYRLRQAAEIVAFEGDKRDKLGAMVRGAADGLRGRLGKTVEPVSG